MYLSDGVCQCSKSADIGHREAWFLHFGGVRGPDLSEYVEQFILCFKKLLHGAKKVPANKIIRYIRTHLWYPFPSPCNRAPTRLT